MTRIVLAALLTALVTACGNTSAKDPSGDEPDTRTFKATMDSEAKKLLPDLVTALGGEPSGMQATFYERGGFGIWDYVAMGGLSRPVGTVQEKLDKATAVLEQHDFVVERDDEQRRVFGTKGRIGVTVQTGAPTTDPQLTSLDLRIANIRAIQDDDGFAEDAAAEDYLAYLE